MKMLGDIRVFPFPSFMFKELDPALPSIANRLSLMP
jgi:hypothetical protein